MAMPPYWYEEGRLGARFHVQVELDAPVQITKTLESMTVHGKVKVLFRGDGQIRVGDPVAFEMNVYNGDRERPPEGTGRWMDSRSVSGRRFFEVFLDGAPPVLEVSRGQIFLIGHCTSAPTRWVPASQSEIQARNSTWFPDSLDIV